MAPSSMALFPAGIFFVATCLLLLVSTGRGDIILRNHCRFSISTFRYGEPSPLVLQPGQPNPIGLKPNGVTSFSVPSGGSKINFWACNQVDKDCNAGYNSATVAALSMGDETNSYQVSAKVGYNLPLSVMAPGAFNCPTPTCTAKLTDCPAGLQVSDSNGNIIGCRSPADSGESTRLIDKYSLMVKGCPKEEVLANCDAGFDLVITFCYE